MAYLSPSITEIYLCDPAGVRIECLDYVTDFEYAKIASEIAPFRIKLPSKFDRNKIRLDNIIEIWRGFGPGTLKWDYTGFVRAWLFADDAGQEYTELYGYCLKELLSRRIVKDYAGSVKADMTDHADDMIKAITKDQLGSDAAAGRDLTSVGGGLTIQADLHDGQSITKLFAYKNVLEICQEICDASTQAGTEVYFDIVPVISSAVTGALAFQLQTFTDQRGNDRTWNSSQPVFIGSEWGNLQNGNMEFDYSEEINYAYALGQGEGTGREVIEIATAPDIARSGMSIWNLREGAKDAKQIDFGDTAGLTGEANTYLNENKPKFRFGGDIVETPAFRYGKDWGFGDRVTAIYAGYQKDAMISKVLVSRDSSGQETITTRLEVEE
jgi:hypothetical protein